MKAAISFSLLFALFLLSLSRISCSPCKAGCNYSQEPQSNLKEDTLKDMCEYNRRSWEQKVANFKQSNQVWNSPDTLGASHFGLSEMMQRILPQVIQYAQSDSLGAFYNNVMQQRYPEVYSYYRNSYAETNQIVENIDFDAYGLKDILLVGKFINKKNTFAIAYNIKKSEVQFYKLEHNHWKSIGRHKAEDFNEFYSIYFEEIDGKPGLEIVMATHPNMNGNSWMELFCYSEIENKIYQAGSFCTGYEINLTDTTVREEYLGSWYMDNKKTLYIWYKGKLVPIQKSVLIVPKSMDSTDMVYKLEYYENKHLKYSSKFPNHLKLVFKEIYNDTNPKHLSHWEYFFKLKGKRK